MKYELYNFRYVEKRRLMDEIYYNSILEKVNQIKKRNNETYNKASNEFNQLVNLARSIWGVGHKEYKRIQRIKIEMPPAFKADLKRLERQRNEELRLARGRIYDKEYRERSIQARVDLEEAGFVEFTDYSPFTAITDRKRLMEQIDGEWVRRQPIEQVEQ